MQPVAKIKAGQPVGELGTITGSVRASDVAALDDVMVIVLDAQRFNQLLSHDAVTCKKLLGTVATRLQQVLHDQHQMPTR